MNYVFVMTLMPSALLVNDIYFANSRCCCWSGPSSSDQGDKGTVIDMSVADGIVTTDDILVNEGSGEIIFQDSENTSDENRPGTWYR